MKNYLLYPALFAFLYNIVIASNKNIAIASNSSTDISAISIGNSAMNYTGRIRKASPAYKTTLPGSITFDRKVVQIFYDTDGPVTVNYYFTLNGDYIMATAENMPEYKGKRLLYTKDGGTALIDDDTKTIALLNMPRIAGEGGLMGEQLAEQITGKKIPKDAPEDQTITKTGNTKMICGYPAYEYAVVRNGNTGHIWFAAVDFDPLRMYTMGVGREAFAPSLKKIAATMKNNPVAIPVINPDYLEAEIDDQAGNKIQETKSITKVPYIFSSANYTIRDMSKMGMMEIMKKSMKNNNQ